MIKTELETGEVGIAFSPAKEGGFRMTPMGDMPDNENGMPEHHIVAAATLSFLQSDGNLDMIVDEFYKTVSELDNE